MSVSNDRIDKIAKTVLTVASRRTSISAAQLKNTLGGVYTEDDLVLAMGRLVDTGKICLMEPKQYGITREGCDSLGIERVVPTPFGQARAKEIWDKRGAAHNLETGEMTPGEAAYVRQLWDEKPGNSRWMDGFFDILNGRLEP
jgi:hypothetical protein